MIIGIMSDIHILIGDNTTYCHPERRNIVILSEAGAKDLDLAQPRRVGERTDLSRCRRSERQGISYQCVVKTVITVARVPRRSAWGNA